MVSIKNYHIRNSATGSFISLELEGEIELIQSLQTGQFYATARRCYISSTFDETTAKLMVGKQIEGSIQRVGCDPYDYTINGTGEVITIAYKYEYAPVTKMLNVENTLVSQ